MADIKISGRKITVTEHLREYVNEKIGDALKVFDIKPMTCDVVLRHERNKSNPDAAICEVTVRVRDSVVRVAEADPDMDAAIDKAADKVTRQLRKYKTKVLDARTAGHAKEASTVEDLGELIDIKPEEEEAEELVREKEFLLKPLTLNQALIEIDLLGHDFYVFENALDGAVNVLYRRNDGGYGLIKPVLEEIDE